MTRSEFIEDITSWGELLEFCSEEDCDVCENIHDDSELDTIMNDYIAEYAREYDWYALRDYLREIPTGYSFYRENGMFDWDGLDDDDFDDYKDDVLRWADNNDVFEEEDEEGETEHNEQPVAEEPEDPPIEDEDFTFDELFGLCAQTFNSIQAASRQQAEAALAEFENFVKCG